MLIYEIKALDQHGINRPKSYDMHNLFIALSPVCMCVSMVSASAWVKNQHFYVTAEHPALWRYQGESNIIMFKSYLTGHLKVQVCVLGVPFILELVVGIYIRGGGVYTYTFFLNNLYMGQIEHLYSQALIKKKCPSETNHPRKILVFFSWF